MHSKNSTIFEYRSASDNSPPLLFFVASSMRTLKNLPMKSSGGIDCPLRGRPRLTMAPEIEVIRLPAYSVSLRIVPEVNECAHDALFREEVALQSN